MFRRHKQPTLWIFFALWSSILQYCIGSAEGYEQFLAVNRYGAPLIKPTESDITLNVGSNFTLQCEAKERVTWKLPETMEHSLIYNIDSYETNDKDRPYGSNLHLISVSAHNVGDYFCVHNDSQGNKNFDSLLTDFKASNIYIFVKDPVNLIVPEYPVITAFQYSDVIVPCKPTSKDIEVELVNAEDESKRLDSTNRFEATIGFIISLVHVTDSGYFICRPKNIKLNENDDNGQNNIFFHLSVLTGCESNDNLIENMVDLDLKSSSNVTDPEISSNIHTISDNFNQSADTDSRKVFSFNKNCSSSNSSDNKTVGWFKEQMSHKSQNLSSNALKNFTNYYSSVSNPTTASPNVILWRNKRSRGISPTSQTKHVNKPTILSHPSGGHASQGENIRLTCLVNVNSGIFFTINWILPNDEIARKENRVEIKVTSNEFHPTINHVMIGKSEITIRNVDSKKDSGYYKCEVMDHSQNKNYDSKLITVLTQDESYIEIHEPSNHYKLIKKAGAAKTTMFVKYRGYPEPTMEWYNNQNEKILPGNREEKYEIKLTETDIGLWIKNIELKDSGEYTMKAFNGLIEKELKFYLIVTDKPTVKVSDVYVKPGMEATVICECAGYPASIISWEYTPCNVQPKWPTCSMTRMDATVFEAGDSHFNIFNVTSLAQQSVLQFTPTKPGIVKCSAINTVGNHTNEAEVLIGDLDESFEIIGIDPQHRIANGDEVVLTCAVLVYNYTADLNWYRNDILVENRTGVIVRDEHTDYSYRLVLTIKKITATDEGMYECRANLFNDIDSESKYVQLKVNNPEKPVITSTNMNQSKVEEKLGNSLLLECKFSGLPVPKIRWYKNDALLVSDSNDSMVTFEEGGSILRIPFIRPEDEGVYKCIVANRLGQQERSTQLVITNMPALALGWIFLICGVILLLLAFIIYLCIRVRRERELLRQMKAAGLANFEEGAVECINPALSLDEQADLLPYDRRFEFPKEKLKLGKQLGAGAFGVVLKAVADGIIPEEKETTVAVKMVKKTADNEVMKALVSELKIMVHLGQHLNVVNLLGAVTKNIAKREVMVIVEYCRYGNVQNFLLKNRKRFVNQINSDTDQIDPTITTREQRWSSDYEYNSKGDRESKLGADQVNSQGYIRHPGADYIEDHVDSCNTEQTLITTIPGDESVILSNNSVQPAWRSNYRPDGAVTMDVNTTHLISWAFQVARGMDYLASKKVLHGDLAARNILLCDDNVVKICDFGLARTMYRSGNYKKQGEAPLPIKWLALESLSDQTFSTYSDVWSYGIVLWEFFSLAKVPYPGMEADRDLYVKLRDGFRMEKPEYANQELYDVMLECWRANPESRPLFNVLEKRFARMLEDDVSNHYIDLNEPYLRMNSEYYKSGKTDYLGLMGCPDEAAPEPPRYINGHILPNSTNPSTSDYLHMSPKSGNAIFSPRATDDYVKAEHFNFPQPVSPTISNNLDSPSNKNRKKTNLPEEIPMLKHPGFESEPEISPDPQSSVKKFSNLNADVEAPSGMIPTDNDNYINRSKVDINSKSSTKDAFSNPSYHMLTTVNETRK